MDTNEEHQVHGVLRPLAAEWTEIQPSEELRRSGTRLLRRHPLRAADALQLAAAEVEIALLPGIGLLTVADDMAKSAKGVISFFIRVGSETASDEIAWSVEAETALVPSAGPGSKSTFKDGLSKTATAMIAAKPVIIDILPIPVRSTKMVTIPTIKAIAKMVPIQGSRLSVKINPENWTANPSPPIVETAKTGSHWDKQFRVARVLFWR